MCLIDKVTVNQVGAQKSILPHLFRQLFYELRVTTEQLVSRPQCPGFVKNMSYKLIGFITRLAPQVAPTQ